MTVSSLARTATALLEAGCRLDPRKEGSSWTTIRMGGAVGLVAVAPDLLSLQKAWLYLCRSGHPFSLLGGGSNVVLPDDAPELVLLINQSSHIQPDEAGGLVCQSGTPIPALLHRCLTDGREALDFMAGIPGTLGGALAVNAGAGGQSIGERVDTLTVLQADGVVQQIPGVACGFGYRQSRFRKHKTLICEARLNLPPSPDASPRMKETLRKYIAHRLTHHPVPWKHPSAGCFFTNPGRTPGQGAGSLLDQAGLKERSWGELSLSRLHANFVINRGRATRQDLNRLLAEATGDVQKRFGIHLEREVILVEPDGTQH